MAGNATGFGTKISVVCLIVFDQGFILPDRVSMVRKKDLVDLHDWMTEGKRGPHEHRPHYQLSSRHLNCYGAERQRVILACQVLLSTLYTVCMLLLWSVYC